MIWAKTEAGRVEVQSRTLVKERTRRNLLPVIDGRKTDDEMLLSHLARISAVDFTALESLGFFASVSGSTAATAVTATASAAAASRSRFGA